MAHHYYCVTFARPRTCSPRMPTSDLTHGISDEVTTVAAEFRPVQQTSWISRCTVVVPDHKARSGPCSGMTKRVGSRFLALARSVGGWRGGGGERVESISVSREERRERMMKRWVRVMTARSVTAAYHRGSSSWQMIWRLWIRALGAYRLLK